MPIIVVARLRLRDSRTIYAMRQVLSSGNRTVPNSRTGKPVGAAWWPTVDQLRSPTHPTQTRLEPSRFRSSRRQPGLIGRSGRKGSRNLAISGSAISGDRLVRVKARALPCAVMQTNATEWARWNSDAWTRSWPKREVLTDSVTPLLLEALILVPDERVLDVGCGGGKAAIAANKRVQPGGSVVGTDLSEALLALAAERAADMAGISFIRADMQVDRASREPFDVVMSQFGVMFFDDPVAAFTNMAAHLRPGGRIGLACWRALDRNPWFVGPVLAPFIAPPPQPALGKHPTGPFSLGDPEDIRQILHPGRFRQCEDRSWRSRNRRAKRRRRG